MKNQSEYGKGADSPSVIPLIKIKDGANHDTKWTIEKAVFADDVQAKAEAEMKAGLDIFAAIQKYNGTYMGQEVIEGNMLLNEGINAMWTLICGGSETAFSNANARIGVGDSTTAEAATQTDLQAATNKLYKAMDGGYPTYGTSQKATFRATFASGEANYAWQEFSVDNGSTPLKNLNRKVSNQGTKTSGQTWQVTVEITLS